MSRARVLELFPTAVCKWSKRRRCYYININLIQPPLPGLGVEIVRVIRFVDSAPTATEAWADAAARIVR